MSGRRLIFAAVLATLVVLVILAINHLTGVETKSGESDPIESVADLQKCLPNLRDIDLAKCEFTIRFENRRRRIDFPAPSDTMWEIRGSATPTESGRKALIAMGPWERYSRSELSDPVQAALPTGHEFLVCAQLNASFDSNGTYPCGFVAILPDGEHREIFFVVRTLDHCLEESY